jgi:hypothetical protein
MTATTLLVPPKETTPLTRRKNVIVKGDSGATNHYWRLADADSLDDVVEENGPSVILPNNATL